MTNIRLVLRHTLTACILLPLVFLGQLVRADLILIIDADPGREGIQTFRSVLSGETFNVQLLLQVTDSTNVDSYRLSVGYDDSSLQFLNAVELQPIGYRSDVGVFLSASGGVVSPFEGSRNDFADPGITPARGLVTIGTLTFTANASLLTTAMITPFEGALDGSFNTNFDQVMPIYQGVSIQVIPVPEPTATMLLIAALVVQGTTRRNKQVPTSLTDN